MRNLKIAEQRAPASGDPFRGTVAWQNWTRSFFAIHGPGYFVGTEGRNISATRSPADYESIDQNKKAGLNLFSPALWFKHVIGYYLFSNSKKVLWVLSS